MPVTVMLSQQLFDKLGEDVAKELVDWFNAVDATYRADLRELNELNFARFDAKLEQRFAESDARWERRLAESDVKWERRLAESDVKWERGMAELRTELARGLADVKSGLKWMYAFWAPTALAVLGTGAGVISLLVRR
ncbi:MAG TPA: hypothetical protein VEK86_05995 [Gemmatimonadales bacterium]|nr:hypothetical protein [Gemmatimonadales bacterium]